MSGLDLSASIKKQPQESQRSSASDIAIRMVGLLPFWNSTSSTIRIETDPPGRAVLLTKQAFKSMLLGLALGLFHAVGKFDIHTGTLRDSDWTLLKTQGHINRHTLLAIQRFITRQNMGRNKSGCDGRRNPFADINPILTLDGIPVPSRDRRCSPIKLH